MSAESHLRRALELAARGDWRVHPNPKVGAVLTRGDEVLAEGWHVAAGGPHAEAAAFAALDAKGGTAKGATLHVTLEPCGGFPGKRTAPCVDAVLARGVARVVVATTDPHPAMRGRSLERLRAAGVEVEVGLLEREARRLNGPFACPLVAGRPYVTAKWAMSLDGKIAARTGDARWISGEVARAQAHALRGEVDAVVVGIGTALADDPKLTRRDAPGRDPRRVVVDSRARLPLEGHLARTACDGPPVLLVAAAGVADPARVDALRTLGVEVLLVAPDPASHVPPLEVLAALHARGCRHLLLEGGAGMLGAFLDAGLVDRVVAVIAPKVIGGAGAPGAVGGTGVDLVSRAAALEDARFERAGDDLVVTGHLHVWG